MPRPVALSWSLRQLPRAVLWLMVATAVVSILTAMGAPHLIQGLLVGHEVLGGQVWRLSTWTLYASGPIALIFACLTLWWFGSDVARQMGRRRFLAFYFGLGVFAAAVTTLLGLGVWPLAAAIPHAGAWPVLEGVIIAWARLFPDRDLNYWGIKLSGRHLVWVTVGGTALFGAFYGLALYLPHFVAQAGALLWLGPIRRALAARQKDRTAKGARGEAWSFDEWYKRDQRRR